MLVRKACVLGRGLGLAVLVSLGALASCAGSEEEALGRSVVLVTLDSTRLDALGAFGGLPGTTPNLDALAGESLGYRWARTAAPLTLPAHTSMFTGFYPLRHGVRGNGPMLVPKEAETLAERARWAGYETAGFVGSLALDWDFGIAQGFRVWRQPDPGGGPAGGGPATEEAEDVIGKAIHWLTRRNPTQPFFLWVHLQDAHAPYTPAPDFYDRPDPYLAEVSGVDRALGRLLDALGEARVLDAGLIAVVGDHGEGRGDHGEETHGLYCYDSTLRVPFLLHYPDGWRAGEQSDEVVSVVDVFPTLLEFMGMPVPQGLDGVSLLRREVPEARGVYFESYYGWQRFGWSPLAGWADAEGKYVHGSAPQYFRPLLDPEESTDWIEEDFDRARYIAAIRRLDLEPKLAHDNDFSVRPEVLADLAALGYGASAAKGGAAFPHPLEDSLRPAPREQVEELADYRRARDLIAMGDYTAAVPLLETLCALNPSNPASLDLLGTALCSSHDYARAVPVLQQRLALSPERMSTHRDLVTCYEALGDARAAQHHSVRSLELLVRTHERRGEQDEASRARGLLGRVRARELPEDSAGDAGAGPASDA